MELLYFTVLITGLWAIAYKSMGMLWIILITATVQPMAGFWNILNFLWHEIWLFAQKYIRKWMQIHMFQRLFLKKKVSIKTYHPHSQIHLEIRWKHLKRGNSLARFPSRCFYDGTLTNGPGTLLREKIDGCGAQDGPWGPKVGCCCWWVAVCW